jgi:hypothetical protein
VDGKANEWPLENRFITDPTADTTNHDGGDIAYISTIINDDYHWYLIESENNLNGARLVMNFSDSKLVIQHGQGTWDDGIEIKNLLSTGTIYSEADKVIELRLTQAQVAALTLLTVETEIDRNFGGAIFSSQTFDTRQQTVSFEVQFTENLGNTTLVLSLDGDRELRITDTNWDILAAADNDDIYQVQYAELNTIDETETVNDITEISGQYGIEAQYITISLPFSVLGLPVVDYNDTTSMATFPVVLPQTFTIQQDYTIALNTNFELKVVNLNFNLPIDEQEEGNFELSIINTSVETGSEVLLTDVSGSFTYVDDVLSVTTPYSAIMLVDETTALIELDLGTDTFNPQVTSESKVIVLPVDSAQ